MTQAILAMLTVWTTAAGDPVYGSACRRQPGGCVAQVEWVVQVVQHYARSQRVARLALATIYHETRFAADATSSIGAFGVMQLHPKSKWGRRVTQQCRSLRVRRTHRLCQELVIREGVALLQRCLDKCGAAALGLGGPVSRAQVERLALGLYSTGECRDNRYARQVLRWLGRLRPEGDRQ